MYCCCFLSFGKSYTFEIGYGGHCFNIDILLFNIKRLSSLRSISEREGSNFLFVLFRHLYLFYIYQYEELCETLNEVYSKRNLMLMYLKEGKQTKNSLFESSEFQTVLCILW